MRDFSIERERERAESVDPPWGRGGEDIQFGSVMLVKTREHIRKLISDSRPSENENEKSCVSVFFWGSCTVVVAAGIGVSLKNDPHHGS